MALRALQRSIKPTVQSLTVSSSKWLAPPLHTTRRAYADTARPRNTSISVQKAMLQDRETSRLIGPLDMDTILAGRARAENGRWLEEVELVSESPDPIVKYIASRYARMQANTQKQLENKEKRVSKGGEAPKAKKAKEIQMTYKTSDADMVHKLNKAREALTQGSRVTIIYSNKKGSARADEAETDAQIQKTLDTLADIGKEWKPFVVLPTRQAMIYLEPK